VTDQRHPRLTPEALAEIYAHARRDRPNECCGVVFGPRDSDVADRVKPCRNVQNELHAEDPATFTRDARTAYTLAREDLMLVDRGLDRATPAKIIYHSHVDVFPVGTYFSQTDQDAALFAGEPAYPVEYVVVDIKEDGPHGAAQFAWDEARRHYVEVGRYE
jgi:adenylyltransferase/sulfurtransferase